MDDPGDRLSNGQFAEKRGKPRGRPFKKGHPKVAGRQKGTPNKATRKVKEFLAALVDNVGVQEAVEGRILKGDAVAFFRALEHVVGKPKETVEFDVTLRIGERIKLAQKRLNGDR